MGFRDIFKAMMTQAQATPEPKQLTSARADGWLNTYTGLGVARHDPSMQTSYVLGTELTRHPDLIRRLLRSNAVARKVVSKQVLQAWGTGVTYRAQSQTGQDVSDALKAELKRLKVEANIKTARSLGRAFGGSLLLMSVDDGLDPIEPLDLNRVRRLLYLRPIDRHDVGQIEYDTTGGIRDGSPLVYTIQIAGLSSIKIHHSRVIRFEGLEVDRLTRLRLNGWTDSVLQPCYDAIKDIDSARQSLSAQMQSATQTVYSVKGLHEQILSGNREFVQDWVASVELMRSNLRAIVLDSDGESIDFESRPLGDSVKVFESLQYTVAAACDMPITELFGSSPSGLSTDDLSGSRRYYDKIEAEEQRGEQGDALDRLLEVIVSQSQVPEVFRASVSYMWPSLYSPTSAEQAQINKTRADTLQILVNMGALTPFEVREVVTEVAGVELTEQVGQVNEDEEPEGLNETTDVIQGDALSTIKSRFVDNARRIAERLPPVLWSRTKPIIDRELQGLPASEIQGLSVYIADQWDALEGDLEDFMSVRDPDDFDQRELARIMRRRARLRADQIVRMIEQARAREDMVQEGATMFIWQTQEDDRVRPDHVALNGNKYSLADGHPVHGFPGDDHGCRCVAILPPIERATGDVSYSPPKRVSDNAKRALKRRAQKPPSQRGMTEVGIARARDLANGRQVSVETLRRMVSYFDRHEVDKQGSTWGDYGKGRQAWDGWGGDEGRAWAQSILDEIDKGDNAASTPADPEERIQGSRRNPEGSASGRRGGIEISDATEQALKRKLEEHNEDYGIDASKKTDLGTLKAVFRRGAGAFSVSHRPGMTRNQWAIARVNAFLRLLQDGKPQNKAYTTDNDLLPEGHPKHSKGET